MLNIACVGSAVFGLFMGYIFAWTTRRNEPSGTDVAGLLATIFSGTLIQMVDRLECADRLPLYLIGVAVGYAIYLLLLKLSWPAVRHSYEVHGEKPSPLFPFLVKGPCTNERTQPPQPPRP
jgi:hypothetical protein